MKKKKVLALGMVACLAATAVVGGTLAYFTDTDAKSNVFTTGNVDIALIENFGDNDPATPEKLIPSTGNDTNGTPINSVTKEVSVKNTGSEKAYVRVHIAIPSILDEGDEALDAKTNVLHFNRGADSIGEGKWTWLENTYAATIDSIDYNVYVATYGTALEAKAETPEKAMSLVYLDSAVTNEDITAIKAALGDNWQIKVIAEGAQEAGFENANDALNAAFGVPGNYEVDWSGAVNQ